MTAHAKRILDEALTLSEGERQLLAESLLDSMPRESADAIERAWSEEAERRAGALERGEVRALDGEPALSELEQQLRAMRDR